MILFLVTVHDTVSETFSPPQSSRSLGAAERSFLDACFRGDSDLSSHPTDYRLMHVGSFDDISGLVTPLNLPVLICVGRKGE